METFSALLDLCVGNSPVTGEFPSQRPVTPRCDVFSIFAWTNGWVNIPDVGDLRRHRAQYDVTVMEEYNWMFIQGIVTNGMKWTPSLMQMF